MIACENSGHSVSDDFPEVRNLVLGGVAPREMVDSPQGLPSLGRSFLYSDETSDKQHRISRNSDFLLLI